MHGSDGLDITLCVTSIAQIILSPDCRTVHGFQALVEREWLQVKTVLNNGPHSLLMKLVSFIV